MLDEQGFRPNVGIILCNAHNQVFWAKRVRQHAWQFPQGGIQRGESPKVAMYRELQEEVGLLPHHVKILARTKDWLHYELPENCGRRSDKERYRGQKQIWFLLRLIGHDSDVCLRASAKPEFDAWRWNSYWLELEEVIEFKRAVYASALKELAPYLQRA